MVTVLAIDQGTTSIKALVFGPSGKLLARASKPIATTRVPEGAAEQDPETIWNLVQQTAAQAISQCGRPVEAVALATQGESVLAFDPSTGTPLTPLITWQDRRASQLCDELGVHDDLVVNATGLPLLPYYSAPKMAWIRREVTTDGVVCTGDTWLLHKLTSEFVTDAATASRSLLVDLESGRWNTQLQDVFGLGDEQMPRIVANDQIIGTTRAFGLPDVPVAGCILDQPAALLAQGCLGEGDTKLTLGTGGFLLRNAGAAPGCGTGSAPISTAWEIRGERTLCEDWSVVSAASAIEWVSSLGLLETARNLDAGCARSAPGQVVFVPGLDEQIGAAWLGMTKTTRTKELVSATVYGLATQLADIVDAAGLTPETVLRLDGGLTNSRTMVQALADMTRRPMQVSATPDATARGAAVLAQLALTPGAAVADLLTTHAVATQTIKPVWDEAPAAAYRRRVSRITAAITAAQAEEPEMEAEKEAQ